MTSDEKLRAIARLMRDSIMGTIGNAVTIDCASMEEAEELFGLLESVGEPRSASDGDKG